MVEDITPAKRHGQWLPSRGAAAVDGADGELRRRRLPNVGVKGLVSSRTRQLLRAVTVAVFTALNPMR